MRKYLIILILLPSICFCQKANLDTNHMLIGDHVETYNIFKFQNK